ncbi:MAG: EpsG family protein [Oscillibacter sp.]|nr:EpsG family protein [Oscillibacter sp.]
MIVWILLVTLVTLCFLFPKSKVAYALMLAFTFIVMAFNTENADTEAYQFVYEHYDYIIHNLKEVSTTYVMEPAFLILVRVFSSAFKCSFGNFHFFLSVVTIGGMGIFLNKYSKYPALMMCLYFISPFFPCDVIQIRNFIAEVIVAHALYALLQSERQGRREIIEYIVKILIAATFHVISLSYLLVLLICYIRKPPQLKLVSLALCCSVGILPWFVARFLGSFALKASGYLSAQHTVWHYKSVLMILVIIADLFVIRYFSRHSGTYTEFTRPLMKKKDAFISRMYQLHILYLFVVPAIPLFSFSLYRIPRNFLILDYLCYSYYLQGKRSGRIDFIAFFYLITGVYWSAANMISQWNVVLQNNILLGSLWF